MINSEIYVCAPEVFMMFSENFDYQNLRHDFIGGVLSEEELGNKIFFHECRKYYAQCVQNLRCFDAVSRDVLGRWTYPFSPDTGIFSRALGGTTYQLKRGNQYLASNMRIAVNVKIQGSVCIGPETMILDDCSILESIIGKNCFIDKGSTIRGSYLHDEIGRASCRERV